MKQRLILGIETSCDETAVAVVENGTKILTNIVFSQSQKHSLYGGVVPEISSRLHIECITKVIATALAEACVSLADMDAIAVTQGPGLVGSLLVGITAAKTLAWLHDKPLIPVNHLAGHIYSARLVEEFKFPLLALIVSGGHTELVLMREHGDFEVIGETRDDAAGEVFDKVARTLGFPYPGGRHIEELAKHGQINIAFPRAWLPGTDDFSFSGVKSAVINYIHNKTQKKEGYKKADIAASFQASIVDVLVGKTLHAASEHSVRQVLLVGGVAANAALGQMLEKECSFLDVELIKPPHELCGDNAAMIGAAGDVLFLSGVKGGLTLNALPSMRLV